MPKRLGNTPRNILRNILRFVKPSTWLDFPIEKIARDAQIYKKQTNISGEDVSHFSQEYWAAISPLHDPHLSPTENYPVYIPIDKIATFSLTEATRTVTFDAKGSEIVLSKTQMKRGKFLFSKACAACHIGGLTKPDPNIGLDLKSLAGALPPRDNIEKIVEFLIYPYSYDGLTPIVERHYCTELAWEYAKMRSLTRPDLVTIAGHILLSAKLLGPKWGGGKVYY